MSQPTSTRGRTVATVRRPRRTRHHPWFPAVLAGVVAACGGDDEVEPIEARFCRKLDACDYLVGYGVGECVEDTQRCTTALTSVERHDWSGQIGNCLNAATCGGFVECYLGFSPLC